MHPMTWRPPTQPHLLMFPPTFNSVKLCTKPLTHGLWRTFQIQIIAKPLFLAFHFPIFIPFFFFFWQSWGFNSRSHAC
jgi:hypothetical protein